MDCTAVDSWFADMDFESCLTEEASNTALMNIPSTNSINSLCTEDFTELLMMEDSYHDDLEQPPNKLLRPNDYSSNVNCFSTAPKMINPDHNSNNNIVVACSSTPIILNFENGNSSPGTNNNSNLVKSRDLNPDEEAFVSEVLRSQDHNSSFSNNIDANNSNLKEKLRCVEVKKKTSRVRLPSQNYDHIIAERKRREQLSQKFLALSTMVPGLKKMDKTSVLSDAIKYLKHLQDKVKTLEAQATKHTMESFVLVKKSQMMLEDEEDDDKSDRRSSSSSEEQPLPEIEARVCNNQILLKIQCHKRVGVMANLLSEVEKLKLSIVSTNATTFGSFALDVTIIAEMETDFDLTMKEVVKRLRLVL